MEPVCIRVVNVRGLNRPDQRAAVCYCGRRFAGWPDTPFGNHHRFGCPDDYRRFLLSLPPAELGKLLADLWEACEHGRKPLGCWCVDWTAGNGPTPGCHAAVWAELLFLRYGSGGIVTQ